MAPARIRRTRRPFPRGGEPAVCAAWSRRGPDASARWSAHGVLSCQHFSATRPSRRPAHRRRRGSPRPRGRARRTFPEGASGPGGIWSDVLPRSVAARTLQLIHTTVLKYRIVVHSRSGMTDGSVPGRHRWPSAASWPGPGEPRAPVDRIGPGTAVSSAGRPDATAVRDASPTPGREPGPSRGCRRQRAPRCCPGSPSTPSGRRGPAGPARSCPACRWITPATGFRCAPGGSCAATAARLRRPQGVFE
jgi:hypothetical protein